MAKTEVVETNAAKTEKVFFPMTIHISVLYMYV